MPLLGVTLKRLERNGFSYKRNGSLYIVSYPKLGDVIKFFQIGERINYFLVNRGSQRMLTRVLGAAIFWSVRRGGVS